MIFYLFIIIEGYDVIISVEFFPHVIVLKDFSLELVDDDFEDADTFLNLWNN